MMRRLALALALIGGPALAEDRAGWSLQDPLRPTLTIGGSKLIKVIFPDVLEINTETGKITLSPRAQTEPAAAAADFWKAVDQLGGQRVCKP